MVKTLTSSWHDGIKVDHPTLGVFDTTITMRYRYNPQGARESKWQDIVKFDYLKTLVCNNPMVPPDLEYKDANGASIYEDEVIDNTYTAYTYKLPVTGRIYDGIVNQYGAAGERYTEYYGRHVDNSVYYFAAVYSLEGGAIQRYTDDNRTEYAIRDHLGSARFIIVQNANGVTYNKPDYDPYGEKLASPAPKTLDSYNGADAESDYTAMGARWYLPEIGRFLSVDPLWAAFPSMSPYVYANNNPMSFKDPSGMAPEKEEGETKKSNGKKSGNKTLTVTPDIGLSAEVYAELAEDLSRRRQALDEINAYLDYFGACADAAFGYMCAVVEDKVESGRLGCFIPGVYGTSAQGIMWDRFVERDRQKSYGDRLRSMGGLFGSGKEGSLLTKKAQNLTSPKGKEFLLKFDRVINNNTFNSFLTFSNNKAEIGLILNMSAVDASYYPAGIFCDNDPKIVGIPFLIGMAGDAHTHTRNSPFSNGIGSDRGDFASFLSTINLISQYIKSDFSYSSILITPDYYQWLYMPSYNVFKDNLGNSNLLALDHSYKFTVYGNSSFKNTLPLESFGIEYYIFKKNK